jgi:hypothetical protein
MYNRTELDAALATREAARAKLESATAALERAREAAGECQQEADRLAAEEASWIQRHAKKLSAWIAEGSRGARPQAMADVKVAAAQMTARANLAAAESARGQFEAAEREARDELAAAERSVESVVDALLAAESIETAEEIMRRAEELARLGARLPNPLNVPLDRLREQPLIVQRACALIDKVRPDDVYRPLSELGVPAVGTFRSDDATYEARRAALIRGEAAPVREALEEAAA